MESINYLIMNTYDFNITQGETLNFSLTLLDANNTPIDLTNKLISGYIKTRYGDSGSLAALSITVTSAVSGIMNLGMPATGTAKLPVNYAMYDIEMLNTGDSSVTKVLAGKISVYPEVTW